MVSWSHYYYYYYCDVSFYKTKPDWRRESEQITEKKQVFHCYNGPQRDWVPVNKHDHGKKEKGKSENTHE